MIDEILVQKMIEDKIHPDYKIFKLYDTQPYIFIFWKHKKYDKDDERGMLIGVGPIVYDKEKKDYTILGSGSNNEHYYKHLPKNLFEEYRVINSFESIKAGILRRKYVNTDDIDRLCQIITNGWGYTDFDIYSPSGYSIETHSVVVLKDKIHQEILIDFWNKINYQYEIINDTEILLWKIKDEKNIKK
ncbi:hypothetical protein [Chryseobacterium echinoideorum]|uniref:hypothetical protein n=1 Tax=Chryseobacterium echinoideorum TaxID=1549648 RepID=UPI0011847349|nr:hypothetical protein [Chryseobacterium echinoideorum]